VGRAEVLLIGGRSGAGKTTVGWEVAARLRAAEIPHRRLIYTNTLSVMPAMTGMLRA
jgi:2-phosphoglycerate kinase